MKQTQLFNPNEAHLGRIAALRARVAEARRAFPDFTRNAGPVVDVPECSCDECVTADDDRDLNYITLDEERYVESMALHIDEYYDVWDAWVDWNHDGTHYYLIVVPPAGHAELRFTDADMALHYVHSVFGDHLDYDCNCRHCTGHPY